MLKWTPTVNFPVQVLFGYSAPLTTETVWMTRHYRPIRPGRGWGIVCLLLGGAPWVHAESIPQPDPLPSSLDDIVVTATRRSTTVLETPASVSAITAQLTGSGGIQTLSDLAENIPGLSVGEQFGVNRAFIRGIGLTSIDLGGEGGVAFLVDGAQVARPAQQLSAFFDMERIEVLRGPQGTLYGRGATAGVINLITRRPSDVPEGYVSLTYGNYADKALQAAIGGPITEALSARVAANIERRGGYGENLFTGAAVDDRNAQSVRASVRVKPVSHLIMDLAIDYLHENDNDYALHYFGPTTTPNAQLPAELYFGGRTLLDCCGGGPPNFRDIWSSLEPINKRHGIGVTNTVEWTPEQFELKSISAYRDFNRFNQEDLAVSNATLYGKDDYRERSDSYSQEFTLSADLQRVDWLAGISAFRERLFGSVRVPTVGLEATLTGGQCVPLIADASISCDAQDSGNYWQIGTVTTTSYGAFLQGTRSLAPGLSLTLGARINHEQRTGVGQFIFDAFGINVPTDRSASWNAVTPKVLLEYEWDTHKLAYASVNRGFKSGVINVGSTNPVVNPEYVYAYEVGVKEMAFDGRAQWTVASFFYDYKDLQIGFVNAQSVVETVNAAAAHNYGVEATAVLGLSAKLQVELSATYLSAKYTSFTNGYYRDNFAPVDVAGNYLDNAPAYTARLAFNYELPLPENLGQLHIHTEGAYQARIYFTEFNNSDATQGGYGILNGSADWRSNGNTWGASAWVRNASNKFAITNEIIAAPTYNNVRVGSVNAPRTFGMTLNYAF